MNQLIDSYEDEKQVVELIQSSRDRIGEELEKVIVGQREVIEQLLIALFSGGHCLITGAPGLGQDAVGALDCPDFPFAVSTNSIYSGLDAGGHYWNGDSGGCWRWTSSHAICEGADFRECHSGRRD